MRPVDVKPGVTVTHKGEEWTVLDKAPGPHGYGRSEVRESLAYGGRGSHGLPKAPGFFWLHRRDESGEYRSTSAHGRDLDLVGDPYAEARGPRRRRA